MRPSGKLPRTAIAQFYRVWFILSGVVGATVAGDQGWYE
jgi:hypothetical protein